MGSYLAQVSIDPLTNALGAAIKSLTDKKGLTSLQVIGILAPVIVGPGLSYLINYLNGNKRLSDRQKQLQNYQAVLQLLDQAATLSAQSEKYDAMFGDKRASLLAEKIMKDAYATFKAPDIQFHFYERTHYSFFMIRQLPIIVRYYVIAMPKTAPAGLLSAIYYMATLISTSIYAFLVYMSATDSSIDGGLVLRFVMILFFTIIGCPVYWFLTRFWRLLFDLRRHYEDTLAGIVVDGPAVAVARSDFRIGAATPVSVMSRLGRPTTDQPSPTGRMLTWSTAPRRSWLWPVPILGRLTGLVVGLFARGAMLDIATEGFDFGPDGVLAATWMSRSRASKAKRGTNVATSPRAEPPAAQSAGAG